MAKDELDLSAVRREIDEVDSALHDLLMRRAKIVDKVKAAKAASDTASYRPGREAEVLRRLADRHQGSFPAPAIYRIWREIMAASVAMQDNFTCAVWDGEDGVFGAIARDHFGVVTPQSRYSTPGRVLNAVSRGDNSSGLLPLPQQDDETPWWPLLYGGDVDSLAMCGRAPCDSTDPRPGALVIGKFAPEETGADRSYLIIETDGSLSRAGLSATLGKAGLEAVSLLLAPAQAMGGALFLAEIKGFYPPGSGAAADMIEETDGIANATFIGACPLPLGMAE